MGDTGSCGTPPASLGDPQAGRRRTPRSAGAGRGPGAQVCTQVPGRGLGAAVSPHPRGCPRPPRVPEVTEPLRPGQRSGHPPGSWLPCGARGCSPATPPAGGYCAATLTSPGQVAVGSLGLCGQLGASRRGPHLPLPEPGEEWTSGAGNAPCWRERGTASAGFLGASGPQRRGPRTLWESDPEDHLGGHRVDHPPPPEGAGGLAGSAPASAASQRDPARPEAGPASAGSRCRDAAGVGGDGRGWTEGGGSVPRAGTAGGGGFPAGPRRLAHGRSPPRGAGRSGRGLGISSPGSCASRGG